MPLRMTFKKSTVLFVFLKYSVQNDTHTFHKTKGSALRSFLTLRDKDGQKLRQPRCKIPKKFSPITCIRLLPRWEPLPASRTLNNLFQKCVCQVFCDSHMRVTNLYRKDPTSNQLKASFFEQLKTKQKGLWWCNRIGQKIGNCYILSSEKILCIILSLYALSSFHVKLFCF